MENFINYISHVIIGIDRIELSLPILFSKSFLDYVLRYCEIIDHNNSRKKWFYKLSLHGCLLTITRNFKSKEFDFNDRIYIEISDPDNKTQKKLKEIIQICTPGMTKGNYGVIIRQLEVSYDLYCLEPNDCSKILRFITDHLVKKYSRSNSYKPCNTTKYVGRNGDIRKGAIGIRSYVKKEFGEKFCRVEFQFNRPHLLKHGISYLDFPINPFTFNSIQYIDFYNKFSSEGIKNITRSALRNEKKYSTLNNKTISNNLNQSLEQNAIRNIILGKDSGRNNSVHKQMSQVQKLKDKHNLKGNYKKYFPQLPQIKQLISCLSDTGYSEDSVSKRVCFCQT